MSELDLSALANWIDVLGWSLLHFLWQGLAIGALFMLGRALIRRIGGSPQQHYVFGLVTLGLLALAPPLTATWLWAQNSAGSPIMSLGLPNLAAAPLVAGAMDATTFTWAGLIEQFLPWLVLAWLAGVVALSAKVFVGWHSVRRMTREGVNALPQALTVRAEALVQQFGIERKVRVIESTLAKVPTVIGWFKPVILLPTSTLLGLTPRQIELVIAHELGHIRRYDYLVNLVQVAIETLLFYHPVVRWVSREVRAMREVCCDDFVIDQCGHVVDYAKALANLESLRAADVSGEAPQPALAATEGPLLKRIERMLQHPRGRTGAEANRTPMDAGTEVVPVPGHGVALGTLVMLAVIGAQVYTDRLEASPGAINEAIGPIPEPESLDIVTTLEEEPVATPPSAVEIESLVNEIAKAEPIELPATQRVAVAQSAETKPLPSTVAAEVTEPVAPTPSAAPSASTAEQTSADVAQANPEAVAEVRQEDVLTPAVEPEAIAPVAPAESSMALAEQPSAVDDDSLASVNETTAAQTTESMVASEKLTETLDEQTGEQTAGAEDQLAQQVVAVADNPTLTAPEQSDQPTANEPSPAAVQDAVQLAKLTPIQTVAEVEPTLRPVYRKAPVYPYRAHRRGQEGHVEIEYSLRADGKVTAMKVIESYPRRTFVAAAKSALREWRYSPDDAATVTEQRFRQRFNFTLATKKGQPLSRCVVTTGSRICRDNLEQ